MAYNPQYYMPQYYTYPQAQYQPQTAPQPVNGLVSVTGMEGAKAYSLPPNSSMPLFDADEDMLYVKTTDAAGYPTIKAFSFKPVEAPAEERPDYVTRADFDALVERIDKLTKRREQVQQERSGNHGK